MKGPERAPGPGEGRRGWLLALGVVAGVHAFLAWALFLPTPHSGGDNTAYLTLAHSLATGQGYTEWWDPMTPPHAKYPPAWSLLLAGLMVLGAESWGAFKAAAAILVGMAALAVAAWAGVRWAELAPPGGEGARPSAAGPGGPGAPGRAPTGSGFSPLAGGAIALLAVLSAGWSEATRWILSEPLFLVGVFLALLGADRAGLRLAGLPWRRPAEALAGPDTPGKRPDAPRARPAALPGGPGAPTTVSPPTSPTALGAPNLWLGVALVGALLALFTRTAGLPLFVGLLVLLAWNARWRILAGVLLLSAGPVGAWILRGRDAGEGAYQDEFWMVNPYRPELGLIGPPELVGRAITNLRLYVGEVLGREWWGALPPGAAFTLGVVLVLLALAGWGVRLARREGGLAELFLPLYGGLILLWPEVWSGDRFALPLYPLLLLWAAESLRRGAARVSGERGLRGTAASRARGPAEGVRSRGGTPLALGALAFTLLAGPALVQLLDRAGVASECRQFTVQLGGGDPFACHGPPVRHFRDAAAWSGLNLPDDAVVINRRPRVFFALGGPPGRVFPFEPDAAPLLALADEIGARYLLVDRVDRISALYLPAIVQSRPEAFCWIRAFGDETVLLGIVPPAGERAPEPGTLGEGVEEAEARAEEGVLAGCGDGWTRPGSERLAPTPDARVPVVVSRLRRRRR